MKSLGLNEEMSWKAQICDDEREVVEIGEYQKWGGMASYSVAPVKAVSSLPQPLDMAQAATLNGELNSRHKICCGVHNARQWLQCVLHCTDMWSAWNAMVFNTGAYETAYHALVHCGRVQQGQLLQTLSWAKHRLHGRILLGGEYIVFRGTSSCSWSHRGHWTCSGAGAAHALSMWMSPSPSTIIIHHRQ